MSLRIVPSPWFRESLANQPVLLGTPHVPRFVHYAAYRDFDGIAPVMEEMLRPSRPEVVSTAATEACLLGLDLEKPVPWVEQIERGPVTTRAAAATVYATNALALYRRRAFRSIQEFVG
jgi:hypothetical protein